MDTAIIHLLPDGDHRPLTTEERDSIEDVLDAAQAWADGSIPWYQAAKYGGVAYRGHTSSAYSRFLAMVNASRTDPRRPHLLALIDEITRRSGYRITEQGVFSAADECQHDGAVRWLRANPAKEAA